MRLVQQSRTGLMGAELLENAKRFPNSLVTSQVTKGYRPTDLRRKGGYKLMIVDGRA